MGRRDQLIRIALAAHQPQILEPVTPADSEDGLEEQLAAVTAKSEKIQRIDGAQEAVLSAIGFMSGAERKKAREQEERNIFSVSAVCGFINYHLPLPLACQRYQAMVFPALDFLIQTFRHVDQSYLSLFKRSWRKAGWSLMCVGMPSLLVYQLGYAFSMHYLQPRIVHRFRKSYPPAAERTLSAFFTRLGVSLRYYPRLLANIASILYHGSCYILSGDTRRCNPFSGYRTGNSSLREKHFIHVTIGTRSRFPTFTILGSGYCK